MQNINLLNFLGINYLLEFILLFLSTHPPPQYFKCKGTAVPSYGTASCVCSWSSLLCHFHSRTSLRLSLFSIQLHCQFIYETFSFHMLSSWHSPLQLGIKPCIIASPLGRKGKTIIYTQHPNFSESFQNTDCCLICLSALKRSRKL